MQIRKLLLIFLLWICVESSLQFEIQQNHYGILGVKNDASKEDIKRAYRKLAAKFHPDKNKEPGADQTFLIINRAHQVLKNKEEREMFDMIYSVSSTKSSSSSQTSGAGGFTFYFNSNYDNFHNFYGHDFNEKEPRFQFNQREFHGRSTQGHDQHWSFFSFDDFFDVGKLEFGEFFGGGDAHVFGNGSSFFGNHFGGRSSEPSYEYQQDEPTVIYEFYPHHDQSVWSSEHTHCQMEKLIEGNRITTTIRCF